MYKFDTKLTSIIDKASEESINTNVMQEALRVLEETIEFMEKE